MPLATLDAIFSPSGRLRVERLEQVEAFGAVDPSLADRVVATFDRSVAAGLLSLALEDATTALPPALAYWREFATVFVRRLCAVPNLHLATTPVDVPCPIDECDRLAAEVPPMRGAEYVTGLHLADLWHAMAALVRDEVERDGISAAEWIRARNPAWHVVGRVHLHLAENKADPERPFAFMATHVRGLSAHGKPAHVPLARAVEEAAGDRSALLSLLEPVNTARDNSDWIRRRVDDGSIFRPCSLTAPEAFAFLQEVPQLERDGLIVRVPAVWKRGRPPRASVQTTIGSQKGAGVGVDAVLDFRVDLAIDGEPLSEDEWRTVLEAEAGLVLLRGQWVEADGRRLQAMLDRYREAQALSQSGGISFREAMRLLAGAESDTSSDGDDESLPWSEVVAGPWLREVLATLRAPGATGPDPGDALHATLRPYQRAGLTWLHLLARLGLGACLADDMGLGKTVQVIALMLALRAEGQGGTHLLVLPASLLGNWRSELARFAPSLRVFTAHPSEMSASELRALEPSNADAFDVVLTTYGAVSRVPWLRERAWRLVVLDEAQAIKNADTAQSRAVKGLRGDARIALTGTPIENRLGDLWSLFDFLNPGLLGNARAFAQWCKRLDAQRSDAYAPLRALVSPYILRRMKTDPNVIGDLPPKTEVKAWCALSRKQVVLYEHAVQDLARQLESADGIARRGVVLASLMRLKQICNHPSQWLGDGQWDSSDSGKLDRLREIAEVVASRQDKLLLFTQFRETTGPLAAFLQGVFGRSGLVLHGDTAVRERKALVDTFQNDDRVPFFVLSLKAGGTGLNLTAASHVVHFDRWWNPAVEDQATDRAFRIGQKRSVLVHKFVCRGSVEERIDALIEGKRALAGQIVGGSGAEAALTELDDAALLKLVALDLSRATEES